MLDSLAFDSFALFDDGFGHAEVGAVTPPLPFSMRYADRANWIKPDGGGTENCSIFEIVLR